MKNKTCSTCKWWSETPIPTKPPTEERVCLKSTFGNFGAYGQDGKAIIVYAHFGCNGWAEKVTKT